MIIGILTFHWATNYGAVLQCYALQSYLESLGHEVWVINYKPKHFDESLWKFFRYRKFLKMRDYVDNLKREKSIRLFRSKNFHLTQRIYCCSDISSIASYFDAIITGSDQVLNSWFLNHGDALKTVTPSYFLGFDYKGKRIGYAVSFGVTSYPKMDTNIVRPFMAMFDKISVRECSGVEIVRSMGRDDAVVVPDPTLLMNSLFYHSLADECTSYSSNPYFYCFFIRHITERKRVLNILLNDRTIIWNNDDRNYSLQGWLNKIKYSNCVVTDSFHCMVMCLKLHKPFIVVTELDGNVGMNDRIYTLLGKLGLEECIIYKGRMNGIRNLISIKYDWDDIDCQLRKFAEIGTQYLKTI